MSEPTLHIFQPDTIKRMRAWCSYCGKLCYGTRQDYYDGIYISFDCGTKITCEGWTPPPKKKCPHCRKWFRPLDMVKHIQEYHKIKVAGRV